MTKPLRDLIVEDSEDDTELLLRELRHGGYELTYARVDTAETLSAEFAAHAWALSGACGPLLPQGGVDRRDRDRRDMAQPPLGDTREFQLRNPRLTAS